MQILLIRTKAGQGRTVKQEQEEISLNLIATIISGSVAPVKHDLWDIVMAYIILL